MKRSSSILLTLLMLAAFACCALAAEFHVAPTGNDANPGTAEKPFATLEKARDAVRSSMRATAMFSTNSTSPVA